MSPSTQRLVAITGATGFLGQHLVRAFADDGWRVRILSRRDPISPFWSGLAPEVICGALSDDDALRSLCDGAEVVVHAGGLIGGRFWTAQQEGLNNLRKAFGVSVG